MRFTFGISARINQYQIVPLSWCFADHLKEVVPACTPPYRAAQ